MSHIFLAFSLKSNISLNCLVSEIIKQMPGSKMISPDWYADRRLKEQSVVESLNKAGHALRFGKAIVDSVDRAAEQQGPTIAILVALQCGVILQGRVSNTMVLLHTTAQLAEGAAQPLLNIVTSLGVLHRFMIKNETS